MPGVLQAAGLKPSRIRSRGSMRDGRFKSSSCPIGAYQHQVPCGDVAEDETRLLPVVQIEWLAWELKLAVLAVLAKVKNSREDGIFGCTAVWARL